MQLFFNGPESFTPDDRYLLGETPEARGLFVAAGFNSIGIQSAGGAGKVLADWIVDGHPPMDLWDVDIRRMAPFQRNRRYLRERTVEALGLLYAMHWPFRQPETARGVRRSALHDRLKARRRLFRRGGGLGAAQLVRAAGRRAGIRLQLRAAELVRPFGRRASRGARGGRPVRPILVRANSSSRGRDAEAVLNRICANDVAVARGRIVYTQWLNERGGIEADLTVTRESEDRFLVVTSAAAQTRDLAWLKRHIPATRAPSPST